jgi:hypothetical protein
MILCKAPGGVFLSFAENSTILGFPYVETGNCDSPDCP